MLKRNINLFYGKIQFDYRIYLNRAFVITKILLINQPRKPKAGESFAEYVNDLYKNENHDVNFDNLDLFLLSKQYDQIGRYSIPVIRHGRKTYITLKNLTHIEFQNALQTLKDPMDLKVMARFEEVGGLSVLASNYYRSITIHNPQTMKEIQENSKLFLPLVFKEPMKIPNTIDELVKTICRHTLDHWSYWKCDGKLLQQCSPGRRRSVLDIWLLAREYDPNISMESVREIMLDWCRKNKGGCTSMICSTVKRRVFYNFDNGGGIYHIIPDEYGLRANQ